jgi:hypothetical protein
LIGEPEEKRPIGVSRCRWEDNIKMDGVVWTGFHLAQDKDQLMVLVDTVMDLGVA